MEDRTNQLIQAFNHEGTQLGLFRMSNDSCPTDYLAEVIKEYFEETDEDNADLILFRYGIKRVYLDYIITI